MLASGAPTTQSTKSSRRSTLGQLSQLAFIWMVSSIRKGTVQLVCGVSTASHSVVTCWLPSQRDRFADVAAKATALCSLCSRSWNGRWQQWPKASTQERCMHVLGQMMPPRKKKLAGAPLGFKAVPIIIKADWAEFATTLCYRTWGHSKHPCFKCFAAVDDGSVHSHKGATAMSTPWKQKGMDDLEKACGFMKSSLRSGR